MMIVIVMMIASYTNDDDRHYHDDRIVHALTIYDATNFLTDGRMNKAILGVGRPTFHFGHRSPKVSFLGTGSTISITHKFYKNILPTLTLGSYLLLFSKIRISRSGRFWISNWLNMIPQLTLSDANLDLSFIFMWLQSATGLTDHSNWSMRGLQLEMEHVYDTLWKHRICLDKKLISANWLNLIIWNAVRGCHPTHWQL